MFKVIFWQSLFYIHSARDHQLQITAYIYYPYLIIEKKMMRCKYMTEETSHSEIFLKEFNSLDAWMAQKCSW